MDVKKCTVCGSPSSGFKRLKVISENLERQWKLSAYELDYIEDQQGLVCGTCGSNLRAMALAQALMNAFCEWTPDYLSSWTSHDTLAQWLKSLHGNSDVWTYGKKLLEVNEAGNLHQWLQQLQGHECRRHPEIDLQRMEEISDNTFDIVVHSDVIEHVRHPALAFHECHRILKPGGRLIFTAPVLVDRFTRMRHWQEEPSFHGPDRVVTEYGADIWTHVLGARFSECRVVNLTYPAGLAYVGVK